MTASTHTVDPILAARALMFLMLSILWRIHVALHAASIVEEGWRPCFLAAFLAWLPYAKARARRAA